MRWLLRYALILRAVLRNAGVEKSDAETLGISLAASSEVGGPEGTCTLSLPADNGLLLSLSYESEMVGNAGNAPVVASGFILRHPIYSRATGSFPQYLW